jgi:hypothetical protein
MAENSRGVVVTETMVHVASHNGDVESLKEWARQGVRVKSGDPLCTAARRGFLEAVRCLVMELGGDINQTNRMGRTPLVMAARKGPLSLVQFLVEAGAHVNHEIISGQFPFMEAIEGENLPVARYLIEAGAEVQAVDKYDHTALDNSARNGLYSSIQFLLEHTGAELAKPNRRGETGWDLLMIHLRYVVEEDEEEVHDDAAFTSLSSLPRAVVLRVDPPPALVTLLRVVVLRVDPPPALVTLLSPVLARMVQEGARLRARLPAYLVRRRAVVDEHCPLLLPPLRAIVHGYMELTTTEEFWATRLGKGPIGSDLADW